eukprot:TRINITY_DN8684_c0_g1_i1.p3 TRINITY_DN8684_c0_g1~~TRINITY_DN8684_c0_g1_i1.p3  ORF type:complete len:52 (-),score=10.08 TRINITY_DN8684_c0_g1_i1:52-207(-)
MRPGQMDPNMDFDAELMYSRGMRPEELYARMVIHKKFYNKLGDLFDDDDLE